MPHRILIVDDETESLSSTRSFLVSQGYEVESASSGAEALKLVEANLERYSVIVLDFNLTDLNGAEVTRKLKALNPDLFILIFSGESGCDAFLLPMRQGACAFVSKGEGLEIFARELKKLVERYEAEHPVSKIRTRADAVKIIASVGMVGESPALARAVEKLLLAQKVKGSVLLLGETGTGKEIAAQSLYDPAIGGSFVGVNCADFTLAKDLAKSEIYGHVKGAFTGADRDKSGIFESAGRGIAFLDELHHMHLDVQVAILRVLQNRMVRRTGGSQEIPIFCRIIAGASPELFEMIAQHTFREDLFQRVGETIVRLPALTERKEDIPLLVEHFCRLWSAENELKATFPASVYPLLYSLPWRGNVRELRNVVFSTLTLCRGRKVQPKDVEEVLDERRIKRNKTPRGGALTHDFETAKKAAIIKLLARSSSLREAARTTGVAPSTLSRFVVKHGIDLTAVLGRDIRVSAEVKA